MSSRKRPVQEEEPLNEAQNGWYAELVDMGFEDEDMLRKAVRLSVDLEMATNLLCGEAEELENKFKEYALDQAKAAKLHKTAGKPSLRSQGAGAAAASFKQDLKGKHVPAALAGNDGQTSKSSMHLVRDGLGDALAPPSSGSSTHTSGNGKSRATPNGKQKATPTAAAKPSSAEDHLAALDEHLDALLQTGCVDAVESWLDEAHKRLRASRPPPAREPISHAASAMPPPPAAAVMPQQRPAGMPFSAAAASPPGPSDASSTASLPALPPPPAAASSRRQQGGDGPMIYCKTLDGKTLTLTVNATGTVLELKQLIATHLERLGHEVIAPELQNLVFSRRNLKDEKVVEDYNIQKYACIHVLKKGRLSTSATSSHDAAASSSSSSTFALTSSSTSTAASAPSPVPVRAVFDGSDGWAVVPDLNVEATQRWFRESFQHESHGWLPLSSNELNYLLNRRTNPYSEEMASFLNDKMGRTAFASCRPNDWGSMPTCLDDLDRQMRAALVEHEFGSPETSLLGGVDDGTFVLGFVQVTRMPVAIKPQVEGANTQRTGRGLGFHIDSPAYGDVILTVTLFGEVGIELKLDDKTKANSEIHAVERATTVPAGTAYAIFSKARWKMKHDAIVGPATPAIDGLIKSTARVGLTLRYVRRSFLELRHRKSSVNNAQHTLSLPLPLPKPLTFVDATYMDSSAHFFSYPAIVLAVDTTARTLTLHYLSDGLIADADEEAFEIKAGVPVAETVAVTPAVKHWLNGGKNAEGECCYWTRRTYRQVEKIREMGPEAFLEEYTRKGEEWLSMCIVTNDES